MTDLQAPPRPTYAELLRRVRRAGLMERRTDYYAVKIAVIGLGLVGGCIVFFVIGDSWLQVIIAAYLALISGQAGTIAHDAGHMQICRSRQASDVIGYLSMNLVVGLSFGWWKQRHRQHHTYPNDPVRDPDMVNGYLSFTLDQLRARKRWRWYLDRHQARFFFPAMFLAQTLAMQISHARQVLRPGHYRRGLETLLLAAHMAGYLTAVVLVLAPLKAVIFVAINYGLFGTYLGGIIAPNHKGMEIQPDAGRTDYLTRQLITSRNIRGGRLLELLFGGLNYQIEHHLFPSMPAPCLRRARPIVRAFCLEHGLPYAETGFIDSYRQALSHLAAVGNQVRQDGHSR